jgi:hypothetical protein
MPVRTEDLGKIFEKAICLRFGIAYNGKYKYSLEEAQRLAGLMGKLPEFYSPVCEHTASGGARYDFTGVSGQLSAKTSKALSGKVAPQVIGQPQPQKFCDELGIPFTGVPELKQHIQTHIVSVLPVLVEHTFDCYNLYYNKARGNIKFVRLIKPIAWASFNYSWTKHWSVWGNSSTLKLVGADGKSVPIVEFQFHSKSRTNMAIRWCYDSVLAQFADHFDITVI